LDEGGSISDYPKYDFNDSNLTAALPDLLMWLRGQAGYQNTFVYTTIMKYYPNGQDGLSMALRLFIHLMGDLHQPLHNMNRVDKEYPEGDAGGNDYPLPYHYDVDELHALWDTTIYEYHNSVTLPFTSSTWAAIETDSSTISTRYPISGADAQDLDFNGISASSYQIGEALCYTGGIQPNQTVPQSYIDANKPVVEKQLVLGGHRLAYAITLVFPNKGLEESVRTFLN